MTSERSTPSPALLFSLLRQRGFATSKRLGQNFLTDEGILGKIVDLAELGPEWLAMEIGPGPGTLTTMLAPRVGHLMAVELDNRLQEFHDAMFGGIESVSFIYGDALRLDLWALARREADKRGLAKIALVGNLPFQITSPLLFGQTGPDAPWSRMTLMIQREVARRIVSPPGGREYGSLSVKVGLWWRVTGSVQVAAGAFTPRPNVDATTLRFDPAPAEERPNPEIWPGLSAFVDAAFNQRRKKMYNSLAERWTGAPDKEALRRAISQAGGDSEARAETLSPARFMELHRLLTAGA